MGFKLVKRLILLLTPQKLKNYIAQNELSNFKNSFEYALLSYSQEGEDLVLNRLIDNKSNGFYIDIGAHHPKRFSNTYLFYQKGWSGINIDPMPGIMNQFDEVRPNDINLELGISNSEQEITYYMFNEPALNTFCKEEAQKKNGLINYKIVEERKVKTHTLKYILDNYLDTETKIDFMTIDAEGYDLVVLQSNDWEKYRPALLVVEDLKKQSLKEFINTSEMYSYLNHLEYSFVAKTFNTLFFKDNRI
jgi:FkbM family methyltransferase